MTLLLTTLSAVELSVWIGVGCWAWPKNLSVCHAGTASQQLMYSAPISASAAEDMSALIICAMVWIAPLLAGDGVLSDMKKCPPARLRALVSDK